MLLPSFGDALGRYLNEREVGERAVEKEEAAPAHYAS